MSWDEAFEILKYWESTDATVTLSSETRNSIEFRTCSVKVALSANVSEVAIFDIGKGEWETVIVAEALCVKSGGTASLALMLSDGKQIVLAGECPAAGE